MLVTMRSTESSGMSFASATVSLFANSHPSPLASILSQPMLRFMASAMDASDNPCSLMMPSIFRVSSS